MPISQTIPSRHVKQFVPSFGPLVQGDGVLFRLWARSDAKIELVLEHDASSPSVSMARQPNGMFEVRVDGVAAGSRYWFRIDGKGPFPDPASRFQPLGVHGPSEVVPPVDRSRSVEDFQAPPLRELVIYELHVGTFTPAGTFLAVIDKLDNLQRLGINVIELMPIAEFAGEHNWGYDGVSLYAPVHSYGTPEDLRTLVREAHRRGLAVCLDVVYNHLGPDGAYHSTFAPRFYSGKHKTPWGDGLNFDGEGCDKVRAYFIESALAWIYDYGIDALRADATHAILDDSNPPFLTELTERVHAAAQDLGRRIFIIAEDERNERKLVLPTQLGGNGFDAVWSDDFHHHMRHRLAGDRDGYYRDFDGRTESIATTIDKGWYFGGQYVNHSSHCHGTTPEGLTRESRVFCIQNHDQIGNRAFGERLSTQISRAEYYAASALLLLAPEIPLLFMGQEWAAPEPFLYFTDHNEELGRLVTEGRRKEFEHFAAFTDEAQREKIPDPQASCTFQRSKLDWALRDASGHVNCLHWYRKLLQMRKYLLAHAEFQSSNAINDKIVEVRWTSANGRFYAVVALDGPTDSENFAWIGMTDLLNSEHPAYMLDPKTIAYRPASGHLHFQRAGTLLLGGGDLRFDAGSGAA